MQTLSFLLLGSMERTAGVVSYPFAQLIAYRSINVPEYKSAYLLVLLMKGVQPSAKFSPERPPSDLSK